MIEIKEGHFYFDKKIQEKLQIIEKCLIRAKKKEINGVICAKYLKNEKIVYSNKVCDKRFKPLIVLKDLETDMLLHYKNDLQLSKLLEKLTKSFSVKKTEKGEDLIEKLEKYRNHFLDDEKNIIDELLMQLESKHVYTFLGD